MNKIILASGYLGSGKTSFIRSFIEGFSGTVALLINDFGKVNIDAMELEGQGSALVELSNGSIFCSCLKNDFIKSLAMLLDYERDLVIIEGSGLADPSNMQDVLKLLGAMTVKPFTYLGSVCLLDGRYFLKEAAAMESVSRQVAHSQVALLNKADLVDAGMKEAVAAKAMAMNPSLAIIETTFGRCDGERLLEMLAGSSASAENQESLNTPEGRPMTLTAEFDGIGGVEELRALLEKLLPHADRMKGYILIEGRIYKAESVQESLEIHPADSGKAPEAMTFIIFLKHGLASLRSIQKMELAKMQIRT